MIHPTSIISPEATVGENVTVGAFSIVHKGVEISDNTVIGSHCELGIPTPLAKESVLKIGVASLVRSHCTFYIGSTIGQNLTTGHYVSIRENSIIGEHFQIGSRGDIQGDCTIGDYTKMHSDVHIGKLSKVGSFVWLLPEVLLTNDLTPPSKELKGVTIEDYVVIAAKALLMPGIKIGKDSVVAAGAIVKVSVKPGMLVSGNPAKPICKANILRHHENPSIKAYPWRYRFHRGYAPTQIEEWKIEK